MVKRQVNVGRQAAVLEYGFPCLVLLIFPLAEKTCSATISFDYLSGISTFLFSTHINKISKELVILKVKTLNGTRT
jgi:hypothetical protein